MMPDIKTAHPILEGMARVLWADLWGCAEEDKGRTYPGQDLMVIAPPTPPEAYLDAARLIGALEQANGLGIWTLWKRACDAEYPDDERRAMDMFNDQDLARHFGSDLMLEACGHGVSWFDDRNAFDLVVPSFEPSFLMPDVVEERALGGEGPMPEICY